MTFLRKRVVPKTPPSLVKLAAIASGVMTGCWSSTPTNDQVPELIYPQPTGDVTGVETTAEPVSCVAGATTRAGPSSLRNSGKTSASKVPASTTGGSIEVGIASCSRRSNAQAEAPGSQHCVLAALVRPDVCGPRSPLCTT